MRRSPEEEKTMFGKQLRLKRFFGGILVTATVAVVAAPSAFPSTSARGGSAQQAQVSRFITDTLGGTRHPVAALQVQPNRFTSDTIAGNDASPTLVQAYNPNGYAPATVVPPGRAMAPAQTGGSSGDSSTWMDIGIASLAALLLVLMLGVLRASRKDEPTVRTA
jgi:hypothetical protein